MATHKRIISKEEVSKHRRLNDCWIIFHKKVYDLTSYIHHHPGGMYVILNHAGTDATKVFESVHSETVLSTLPDSYCIGIIKTEQSYTTDQPTPSSILNQYHQNNKLHQPATSIIQPLNAISNLNMFRKNAIKIMKPRALNYCIPGADDEITLRENIAIYTKILLKPKCIGLNHATNIHIDTNWNILGTNCSLPIFLSPTGLNKLFHPNGELAVIYACYKQNIIPIISTFSSYSMQQIFEFSNIISNGTQNIWFQLYVCQDHNITKNMLLKALKYKVNTFVITVDAPQVGRREKDIRYNLKMKFMNQQEQLKSERIYKECEPHIVKDMHNMVHNESENVLHAGTAGRLSSFINPSLTWNDIVWIRTFLDQHNKTNKRIKLILKVMEEYNDIVDGIILSNHGGRQLDTARSSLEVLQEVMDNINLSESNIKIYIDGGIRNGVDVFKAIAMGAYGVGIGRPYVYGMACYGCDGIRRVVEILKNEFVDIMREMGVSSVDMINKSLIVNYHKKLENNHFTFSAENWN
eukprot:59504_1